MTYLTYLELSARDPAEFEGLLFTLRLEPRELLYITNCCMEFDYGNFSMVEIGLQFNAQKIRQ